MSMENAKAKSNTVKNLRQRDLSDQEISDIIGLDISEIEIL